MHCVIVTGDKTKNFFFINFRSREDDNCDSNSDNMKRQKPSTSHDDIDPATSTPPPSTPAHAFDISNFVGKNLTDGQKYDAMTNILTPPPSFSFPTTKFGTKNRSFRLLWLSKYPGLVYSPSCDGAYCLPCVMFHTKTTQSQLVMEPFRNWKKATERFDEHFFKLRHNCGDISASSHKKTGTGYEAHMDCVTSSQNFMKCMKNEQLSVVVALDTAQQQRKKKNMAVLRKITQTVLLCA